MLKWNIKAETRRLRISNQHIFYLTKDIWSNCFTDFQRDQFKSLADKANKINNNVSKIDNTDTLKRIAQISSPQETNNLFAANFLNGTKFNDDNNKNPDSLFLPAGIWCDQSFSIVLQ